jgi:uncharacterized Zn-finger protein
MICSICEKSFISKTSLAHHQKTAKFCLKLQGKNNELYSCEYCDKMLSTNNRLLSHYIVC